MPEQSNTSELGIIITVVSGVLIGWWKYITEKFRSDATRREEEATRQERERSETITKAVNAGMESFNREIRQEFKDYKAQNDKQFEYVNKRIDDVMLKLDK